MIPATDHASWCWPGKSDVGRIAIGAMCAPSIVAGITAEINWAVRKSIGIHENENLGSEISHCCPSRLRLISILPDCATNSTPAICWSACSAMFSSSIRNTPLMRMFSNDGSASLIGVLR